MFIERDLSQSKLWQTGPLPAPSKCKSGRFNAWELNASDDPLEVVERKDTARKTQTKEFIEKVQTIIDESPQRPIRQIAKDLGVWHTTVNACLKEDLKCRSYRRQSSQIWEDKEPQANQVRQSPLLTRPEPAGLLRLCHTSRTSPTWLPTTPKPAWSPPSAEYSPSSRWRLWKRHTPCSGSRRWLRLKAATLSRCQPYYIIKLPELIF